VLVADAKKYDKVVPAFLADYARRIVLGQ
jgi:hypothetical protein